MKAFVAVAESGSLTKAAEQLGLAQPALTQTLNRLESELGLRLFERSRRGAALTAAGEAIAEDVSACLAKVEALAHRARAVARGESGQLIIGFVTHASYEVIPKVLRHLRCHYPQVAISLKEMGNREIVQALEKGTVDLAILHSPVSILASVREILLSQEPLVAVLQASAPCSPDGSVSLADIARQGLIWFPPDDIPVTYLQIMNALRSADCEVRVVQHVNRASAILSCVGAGMGWSLLPVSAGISSHRGVRFAPIRGDATLPLFELSAVWRSNTRYGLSGTFESIFIREKRYGMV